MRNVIVEKSKWADELTYLWKRLDGKQVEVEVEALKLGDQIEAEHVPLKGLSYDPKDDVVQVWVGDIDHMIHHPQKIMIVYDDEDRLVGIDITDAEGEQHLITPQEPVVIDETAL